MPTAAQAAILGVVQGLTEFLPVSSSAHLILARAFFGFDAAQFGLAFDVAVHVGTLLAVVGYFWQELLAVTAASGRMIGMGGRGPLDRREAADRRLVVLLAVGTLPVAAIGAAFGDFIEAELRSPEVAAVMLALGALGFFVVERLGEKRRSGTMVTIAQAWWIGCAQALALVPGVSRSGATITVAMFFGLARPEAARFVFLLGVPAILGAALARIWTLEAQATGGDALALFLVGVATSAIVGYLAIRFFIRYLANHSLHAFGWYRLALAAGVLVWVARGL